MTHSHSAFFSQVTIYRMVCKNTIEERILNRARVKFAIQNVNFRLSAAITKIAILMHNASNATIGTITTTTSTTTTTVTITLTESTFTYFVRK
jgi:hypothetical protein